MRIRMVGVARASSTMRSAARPGATLPEMAVACAQSARTGLIGALTLCVLAYAVSAIFYALASRTLREDFRRA